MDVPPSGRGSLSVIPIPHGGHRVLPRVRYDDVAFQEALMALRQLGGVHVPIEQEATMITDLDLDDTTAAVLYIGILGRSLPLEALPSSLPESAPIESILTHILGRTAGSEPSRAGRILDRDRAGNRNLCLGRATRVWDMSKAGWSTDSSGFEPLASLDAIMASMGNSGYYLHPAVPSEERTRLLTEDGRDPAQTRVYSLYIYSPVRIFYSFNRQVVMMFATGPLIFIY